MHAGKKTACHYLRMAGKYVIMGVSYKRRADMPTDTPVIFMNRRGYKKEMKLITVRELYKNREAYLDKEITVGGWVRSIPGFQEFWFPGAS